MDSIITLAQECTAEESALHQMAIQHPWTVVAIIFIGVAGLVGTIWAMNR